MNDRHRRWLVASLLVTILSFLALTSSFGNTGSNANGQIVGSVVDESGAPLPNVTVILLSKQRGAFTDSAGAFLVRNVPPGTYTLRAQQIGFERRDTVGVEVAAGGTSTVKFVLGKAGDAPPGTPVYTGQFYPCDSPWGKVTAEQQSVVVIGVHSHARGGTRRYEYKILNRGQSTLTEIRLGFDGNVCELTGMASHVAPDTAYGPPGWVCTPVQADDPRSFALSWIPRGGSRDEFPPKPRGTKAGIPPGSLADGFVVVLSRRDPLYAECHWFAASDGPSGRYLGMLRPARDLDDIKRATGAIAGRVSNQGDNPISGANVSTLDGELEAASASDGS